MDVGEPSKNIRRTYEVEKKISNFIPNSLKIEGKSSMNKNYHTRKKCRSNLAISYGFDKALKQFEDEGMFQIPLSLISYERRKDLSRKEPLTHEYEEYVEAMDTLLSINIKWGSKGEKSSL